MPCVSIQKAISWLLALALQPHPMFQSTIHEALALQAFMHNPDEVAGALIVGGNSKA